MGKKLLLFVSVLLLGYSNVFADEALELPDLPSPYEDVVVVSDQLQEKTFFDKLKSFFGFGDSEEREEKEEKALLEKKELQMGVVNLETQNELTSEEINFSQIPEIEDDDFSLKLPEGFADEDLIPSKSLESDKTSKTTQEPPLSLPAGFEEDTPEVIMTKDDSPDSEEVVDVSTEDNSNEMLALPSEDFKEEINLTLPTSQKKTSDSGMPTVPSYAGQESTTETSISKYQRELQTRIASPSVLPKISSEEFNFNNIPSGEEGVPINSADLDADQLQFVTNEAQVLILPNDDVVLGDLTEAARLEQMDLRTYAEIFWKNYDRAKRKPKRDEIQRFIENYDENFNEAN